MLSVFLLPLPKGRLGAMEQHPQKPSSAGYMMPQTFLPMARMNYDHSTSHTGPRSWVLSGEQKNFDNVIQ